MPLISGCLKITGFSVVVSVGTGDHPSGETSPAGTLTVMWASFPWSRDWTAELPLCFLLTCAEKENIDTKTSMSRLINP